MILFPGHIAKVETLRDKSIKITLETLELPPDKAGKILTSQNESGFFAFKPEEFKTDDVALVDQLEHTIDLPRSKSPSQRQRNVLYRCWELDNKGYDDFNLYYIREMENIINHYKSKLA